MACDYRDITTGYSPCSSSFFKHPRLVVAGVAFIVSIGCFVTAGLVAPQVPFYMILVTIGLAAAALAALCFLLDQCKNLRDHLSFGGMRYR